MLWILAACTAGYFPFPVQQQRRSRALGQFYEVLRYQIFEMDCLEYPYEKKAGDGKYTNEGLHHDGWEICTHFQHLEILTMAT